MKGLESGSEMVGPGMLKNARQINRRFDWSTIPWDCSTMTDSMTQTNSLQACRMMLSKNGKSDRSRPWVTPSSRQGRDAVQVTEKTFFRWWRDYECTTKSPRVQDERRERCRMRWLLSHNVEHSKSPQGAQIQVHRVTLAARKHVISFEETTGLYLKGCYAIHQNNYNDGQNTSTTAEPGRAQIVAQSWRHHFLFDRAEAAGRCESVTNRSARRTPNVHF